MSCLQTGRKAVVTNGSQQLLWLIRRLRVKKQKKRTKLRRKELQVRT